MAAVAIRNLKLTRDQGSIAVRISSYEGDVTAVLKRSGKSRTEAKLPLTSLSKGIASFDVTNEAHMLPFGRYELIVKSGCCVCAKLPVQIPKCSATRHGSCDTDEVVDLPPRDCEVKPKKECKKEESICDLWNKDCGNEISKSEPMSIDVSLVTEEYEVTHENEKTIVSRRAEEESCGET